MSTNINFIKLSQVTTVCFDKDKALCDGSLTVKKLVILDRSKTESEVSQIISNVLNAVDQHSLFISALKEKYDYKQSAVIKAVMPYDINSEIMGATFKGDKTYILGSIGNMPLKNKAGIIRRSEEFINQGQDVYVLGYALGEINKGTFNEELDAVALIIVKESIRKSIPSSIKWLNDNNIKVKVISSDSPIKTAAIAYEAGVKDADKQIDASINTGDEYVIYGNTSKEQKKKIIKGLKAKGEKVLVVDDDYGDLSKLFENSKRLTNNLSKAGLFLISKVLLAVFLTIFLVVGYSSKAFDDPFNLYRYFIFDAIVNAVSVFMIMIDKYNTPSNGKFIGNVFKKSLPGALLMFIPVVIFFMVCTAQKNNELNLGFYDVETTIAAAMISIAILGLVVLHKILSPLNKYRHTIMVISSLVTAILLAVSIIVSYTTNRADFLFGGSFMEMSGPTYLVMAIITIIFMGLYITIYRIIDAVKGRDA